MNVPEERRLPRPTLHLRAGLILLRARWLIETSGFTGFMREFGYEAAPSPAAPRGSMRAPDASPTHGGHMVPQQIGHAVSATARWLPGTRRCLVQAVAAALLLQRYGHEHLLVIGGRPVETGLTAHAWVVSANAIIVGAGIQTTLPVLATFHAQPARAAPANPGRIVASGPRT